MVVFKTQKKQNILQIGIFVMCLKTAFRQSAIIPYTSEMDNVLTIVAVVCLCEAILHKKYTIKMLTLYCAITLISLFSVVQTKNYGFLITIIVCLAIRGVNIDKILASIFKYQIFFLVLHTSMAIVLSGFRDVKMTMVISGVKRYCFGFTHPNFFSIYLFNLLILWTWLNYEKLRFKHIINIMLIAVVSLYFTKTRTSFITTIIFCVLILISKSKYLYKKMLIVIAKYIIPICAISTIGCVKLYMLGNKIVVFINELLSNRIKLGAYGYLKFGYSFWGQDIKTYDIVWDSQWRLNSFTFDNLYIFLSINQGIIWIVILSAMFYLLARKQNLKISVFIIIWAIYGIAEVHGLNGFICFPIFLITLLLEKKHIGKEEGIENERRIDFHNNSGI